MQPKFFHKLDTPIPVLIHLKTPRRNAQQDRHIPITFRLPLNGNTVRSAPPFIKSAYEEIKNGADFVGLKKELENLDVELFNLAENKRPAIRLPRLHLTGLAVKEVKTSENDTAITLTFQTLYPWDPAIWEYLGDHYGTEVYAKFDAAQATLVDVEDEGAEDEEQAELPEAGEPGE
jgi:hypothetical protein